MEKTELFSLLKSEPNLHITSIEELDEKKIYITILPSIPFDVTTRQIRKSILSSSYDQPILVKVSNSKLNFDFSVFGGIYEFPHNDADYRVEFDLITYIITINGLSKTFERASFESSEHFKDIVGYIEVIKHHREIFLAYSNSI